MSRLTRREFLGLSLAAFLQACAKSGGRVVNFFNWSKYIAPDTLPRFTKDSGVAVNYEELADEEEMFAKLRAGARGYDLICGTDYMIPRMRGLNVIDPFPPEALPNAANLDPRFRDTPFDPGSAFTIPYLWGSTGIAYNKAKVAKPPTSWLDLWDPRYTGKISMLDNARDCVSTALLIDGVIDDKADAAALEKAKKRLLAQRPLVKQYSSTTYIDALVAGEVHLAMGWSGDVMQAARENPQIDYVIPKEGSYMWVDNLCLMRGSLHREDTLRLVDYLLRPDVGAEIANFVRYPTPNAAARKKVEPALLSDPRVYPTAAVMKRLRFHGSLDPETSQQWNDLWQDVKVG